MNEQMYLSRVDAAKSQAEHWRLKIEQERRESEIRLQNLDTETKHEHEMSQVRFRDYQSHIENARRDEDDSALASWMSRTQQEERDLRSRLDRIAQSVEEEKRQSAYRIQEYEKEIVKAKSDIEENAKLAAQERHARDEKKKQLYALEVANRLLDEN